MDVDKEVPMSNNLHSAFRPPRTLTEREIHQLLTTTGEHVAGWRDHLLFAMALGTGLREHELVALDVGDVFDETGRARRRVALRVFKRSNRDRDAQEVVLPDALRAKLERYLARRRSGGESVASSSPLFVSRISRRLSTRQARRAFAEWQARAGFERRFTFHTLRHSACTNLYRRTKDIRLVQKFARHKSLLSTQRYTHASDEELVRAVQGLAC